ncbi:MAG: dihydrolipoyl dehydrogenase [Polyangiales bacterium]
MRELTTDVAIIGAGTAGANARREVDRAGKRWLLIEARDYGTTCAKVGCMPSKLLIAAAEAAHAARTAGQFGIAIAPAAIQVDGPAVMARVQRERDRFARLTSEEVEKLPAEQRLAGEARFVGPTELIVSEGGRDHTRVRASAVVIATGSRPIVPPDLLPLTEAVLTTDSVFELPDLMRSVAVFGTGAIGLELGQALHLLGVRVVFYNPKDELGSFSDPEIDRRFREHMHVQHTIHLGYKDFSVQRAGDGYVVRHRDPQGQQHEARVERLLSAAGRQPNVDRLALDKAGVALDDRKAPRFDPETMQCGELPIFIAGDAAANGSVLHEAVDEGAIAGANAARYPQVDRRPRRVPLRIGFTQPRIATLGKRHAEVSRESTVIGAASYADQGRARVIGQTVGHVRVYVERATRALVGAELFGPGVEHSAHLLAWAVQAGTSLHDLLRMPVYHPTLEEGIRTALRDAAKQLELENDCAPADRGWSSGT